MLAVALFERKPTANQPTFPASAVAAAICHTVTRRVCTGFVCLFEFQQRVRPLNVAIRALTHALNWISLHLLPCAGGARNASNGLSLAAASPAVRARLGCTRNQASGQYQVASGGALASLERRRRRR